MALYDGGMRKLEYLRSPWHQKPNMLAVSERAYNSVLERLYGTSEVLGFA